MSERALFRAYNVPYDADAYADRPTFGKCACSACDCNEPPEKARELCRRCRRGYHRPVPA